MIETAAQMIAEHVGMTIDLSFVAVAQAVRASDDERVGLLDRILQDVDRQLGNNHRLGAGFIVPRLI